MSHRASLGVRPLKVMLMYPEVGSELLPTRHRQRLVMRAVVLRVRRVREHRRPQDRLPSLRLEGDRARRQVSEARAAALWHVIQICRQEMGASRRQTSWGLHRVPMDGRERLQGL